MAFCSTTWFIFLLRWLFNMLIPSLMYLLVSFCKEMLNSKINPYVVEQQKFLLDAIDVVIWSILFFTGKNYKQLWMTLYNVLEEHWKKVDLRCILVGAGDTVAPFPVQLTVR